MKLQIHIEEKEITSTKDLILKTLVKKFISLAQTLIIKLITEAFATQQILFQNLMLKYRARSLVL